MDWKQTWASGGTETLFQRSFYVFHELFLGRLHLCWQCQDFIGLPRQLNTAPLNQIVGQYFEVTAHCGHSLKLIKQSGELGAEWHCRRIELRDVYLVCIPRRVFNGAVVHFFRIWFEIFGGIMAGQAEVDQVRLATTALAIAQQYVGAFQISVHVSAFVNILIDVNLRTKNQLA